MHPDLALFSLRVALFLVFVYEGWVKLADLKKYAKDLPGGLPMTLATGLGEFFGSLAMLTGFLAQWAGWGLVVILAGATVFALKWKTPFHTGKTAGWDFNLLLLVMSLTIALSGPGSWTLNNWIN
jgi:putative oxidoreductase